VHNREITIDTDFSKRINIGIDSTVEFSVAGRSFVFNVVGIRESKQKGVTPFFYFQIPNNAIYGAPKTYFLATSVSENIDGWKSRILNETGTYISFIDV
jgi:predicted lysophospholipase L1 biosynthesis ABC-type transport system permease subunit